MKPRQRKSIDNLYQDLGIITLSIILAVLIARSGAIETFVASLGEARLFGSLFAGLLFTSVFTTAPAAVLLGELAQANSPWTVAAMGALGALSGDYLIYRFVRDRFTEDVLKLLRLSRRQRLQHLLKLRSSRWVLAALGMLIIASPLPDELGITLLGFSKTQKRFFIPLSLLANFIGILLIGLAAQSLE